MTKNLGLTAALAIVFALPVLSKDEGFNGKWMIDKQASTATFDIPDQLMQQIKQKGSDMNIMTTWKEPHGGIAPLGLLGVMTTNLKISVDGQESTNEIGPFKQVSKTTQSANQLKTVYTAVVNGEHVTGNWTRTVSDDGKQMTLEIDQKSATKTNQAKLVFRRK